MRPELCPKCNGKLAPSDTHCLDCGEDIIAHMEELRKGATSKRELTDEEKRERARSVAAAAAAGKAFGIEDSKKTRLRTFDQAEAETTKGEIGGAWGTAAIALVCGIAALAMGFGKLKAVGGLSGLGGLSFGTVREMGFGMFADNAVQAVSLLGTGLGCILCVAGQSWRAILAHQSVAAVAQGEKPVIVYMTPPSRIGLYLISVALPPVGIIIGVLLKLLSRDADTRALGGTMCILGLAVSVIIGGNMLLSLGSNLKAPEKVPGEEAVEDDVARAVGWAVHALRRLC